MRRPITIALLVLIILVAAMPLSATSALAANEARPTSHVSGQLTLPFTGIFSGTYVTQFGGTTYNGCGLLLYCGLSRVNGVQMVTFPPAPFQMTITTPTGSINLHVPFGTSVYQIDGGTGCFARVLGGTGHFSLHQNSRGTFSGCLSGTIVFA